MAETAVSMARSMLSGAISKAASAAPAELSLVMGVQKDIWFIKDELETMQAFLAAAEKTKHTDMLLKVWAEQVRDLSYNIEDCLDEFMFHVRSQPLAKRLMKLKDRRRIAIQISNLKSRVEEVSRRKTRYNLIKTEGSRTVDEVDSYSEDVRNYSSSNIDEGELVGFSKSKKELIELADVNTKDGHAKVICVVGMGGLGKTTLARKAYESKEDIVNNFSCCAWITVSQSFFKIEMLKDMIRQLMGVESLKKCLKDLEGKVVQVNDLAEYLRENLKDKRYFIVLDDVWTLETWRWIEDITFPSSNKKGSRIIVTTRNVGLAKECTHESFIYYLNPLDSVDATSLLLKKSRKLPEDMEKDEKFKNIVQQLVRKCGHLPLAILTIGGILATKRIEEWEQVYRELPSELESNPSLEAMRRMVTLSYNDLPSHLKSCFLYLSIFPEDWEIQRRRVVERWIAEGFVRARTGVNIEDVGKAYFNELINRSLIQASRVNIEGVVKSCRVHGIVRDVMVSISRDENFVHVAGDDVLDLQNAQFQVTQKDISNIGLLRHLKYVNFSNAAKRCSYIYKLPRSIGKLQGLLTLDVRHSYITVLPKDISKLKSLHSLRCNSRGSYYGQFDLDDPVRCLGSTFCFPMLFTPLFDPSDSAKVVAELHMAWSSRWSDSMGVRMPRGIGKLQELQILEVVDIKRTSSKAVKELGGLVQLKKLSVETTRATKRKCKVLCDAIQNLSVLRSLHVRGGTLEWLHVVSSPPPLLRKLRLGGYLGEIPVWFGNLMHLVKLHLVWSQLKEEGEPMEILGALPNLMLLSLGARSYSGEILVFKTGAFPNLKIVSIEDNVFDTYCLKEVKFEDGTSPHIERIEISWCRLESGISGINHLPRLKEISLGYKGQVAKLAVLQGEVDEHPNSPVLRLYRTWSDHVLGDDVQGSNDAQVEGATPFLSGPAAAASAWESSSQPTSDSQDGPMYTYNSC